MDLAHIKAIIFDAEGVVVDTEALWDKSQDLLLGKRKLHYDRAYLKPRMAGQTLLEGAQLMVEYYQLAEDPLLIEMERSLLIHDLFASEIAFIAGFDAFIGKMATSPMKKGIATAMKKSLMVLVEQRLQLTHIFGDHIYYIEDVGNKSKPSPDVFLYAADKLGEDPAHCLVIEDAPHGIEAARRAGMTSVGITTTFSRQELQSADYVAGDFADIANFLVRAGVQF
ncbi:MAG: HAD family phosphatase [Cyclobacteriaceae bacterium]|nr:HAD family phosphatase [Cyclobacteriaceae bacterium]